MARAKNSGNGRLEEAMTNLNQAMAMLAQNQAAFLSRASETDRQLAETNRRMDETNRINSERFTRIETILAELTRMMRALPKAVREKIGFKPAAKPSPG